ncbi:MAG: glycosyltransferase family 2 protein [Planctomycetota bacterium]
MFIPTLNGGDLFGQVLDAVYAQKTDYPFEVIVIDSGSTDSTLDHCARYPMRLYHIDKRTFNHGLTRNLGISKARGEVVALLTQDAVPADEHWLDALVQNYDRDPWVAGVYSRQLPREDCEPFVRERILRWSAGRTQRTVQKLATLSDYWNMNWMQRLELVAFDDVASSVRKQVWQEIPYERRSFGEDVAWGKKVVLTGYKIVFEPASAVIHSHNDSLWKQFRRIYCDHQNLHRLIGITTNRGYEDVFTNTGAALGYYAEMVDDWDWPWYRRWKAMLYAFGLAVSENLAQFMGSASDEWLEKYPWFRPIDIKLRRGI